jgi:DMSO reductase anchor subunit
MTSSKQWIDEAAFGVVYGSIAIMALLMAIHRSIEAPGKETLFLFGSVFAVAVILSFLT